MHIPDGLLDPATCAGTAAISATAVGYALRRVRLDLPERAVPLMGVTAASIFAAQMLNFPVPGGTSGHVLGGVLAGVMLGPWAGMLVMTIILVVQCLLFQDGGLAALGANVLNMAVVGSGLGFVIYDVVRRQVGGLKGTVIGAVLAAWFSVMTAATLCSIEVSLGGHYRLGPALGAMLLVHSMIGLGESLATGLALSFILRVRPDLVFGDASPKGPLQRGVQVVVAGLAIALLMAAILSPFASSLPDGLEASIKKLGFDAEHAAPLFRAPFPDYNIASLESLGIAGSIAGVLGTMIAFAIALGLASRWPRRPSAQHV